MRKIKKITISLVLLICFLITLSTVPNLVSSEVLDGKVELNNGILNREKMFNENQLLAPSQVVSSKEVKISNSGDYSLRLFEKFHFSLNKDGLSKSDLDDMLENYYVKANFNRDGTSIQISGLTDSWIKASEFNRFYEHEKTDELIILHPNEVFTMGLDVKLDEEAGNSYQSVQFNVDFFAGGTIDIAQTGLPLPETATNSFNFIFIGTLLIFSGSALYLFYKRKKKVTE